MEEGKITIFMTGATGHMGIEAVKLFAANRNIKVKLLSLGNRPDKRILKPFIQHTNIEVLKGDLRNMDDIRKGIKNADYVLHLGALIPPAADYYPEIADEINFGGTLNIIQAIKEQNDPDSVRFVYIATVASMGNRPAPVHWCRTGDPIKVSKYDAYGASKIKAERAVIESGLKHWVSLRQSGMLHKDILKIIEPIIFHQPLNNHIEWSTAEDSGRALYNICTNDLPDEFWRNMYNVGSGEGFRETYLEFIKKLFRKIGIRDIRKIFKPTDFSLQNFHCVWYKDSQVLDNWLNFRKSSYQEFLDTLDVPFLYKIAGIIPPLILRKAIFEPLAKKAQGTMNWIKNNLIDKIIAYWGSKEKQESVPKKWDDFIPVKNPAEKFIFHGFDENKPAMDWTIHDCCSAAEFRGGKCLSNTVELRDIYSPLKWQCACGNEFEASPNLVLRGGHWCPDCDLDVDKYKIRAEKSQFFAQVYDPLIGTA
ncbi:MAG: NAD-dependent epimerase/dehydratase family protein [Spirochaetales bacterium]|nr:NAD-dependent epimerase/dehydratase family protein [Spirochaetales bacterium]